MQYKHFCQSDASLNSVYSCVVGAAVTAVTSYQFTSRHRSGWCFCVRRSRGCSQSHTYECLKGLLIKVGTFLGQCELQEYDYYIY